MMRNSPWRRVRWGLITGGVLPTLLFTLLGNELAAQQMPEVGSPIRFSTDSIHVGRWTTGRYLSLDDHALHLVSQDGDTLHVPRPALYHVEASQGQYAHPKAGALVGVGAGAAAAFLIRTIACSDGDDLRDRGPEERQFCARHGALRVSLIGGFGGGLIGGVLGQIIKSDRWQRITIERDPRE